MKKFEYLVVDLPHMKADELNGYGKDGWDMVGFMGDSMGGFDIIFKRELIGK